MQRPIRWCWEGNWDRRKLPSPAPKSDFGEWEKIVDKQIPVIMKKSNEKEKMSKSICFIRFFFGFMLNKVILGN